MNGLLEGGKGDCPYFPTTAIGLIFLPCRCRRRRDRRGS